MPGGSAICDLAANQRCLPLQERLRLRPVIASQWRRLRQWIVRSLTHLSEARLLYKRFSTPSLINSNLVSNLIGSLPSASRATDSAGCLLA
jgi:hypothetical protein